MFGANKRSKDGLSYVCRPCHNEQTRESHKKAYWKNPQKHRERSAEWIKKNYSKAQKMWQISGKKYIERERLVAIKKYGGKCACCGETEVKFLSFDHINGGGNKHRKLIGGKVVRWLKRNNYPKDIQILCHNCNLAKGFYGECPHKTNAPNKQKKSENNKQRSILQDLR